MINFNINNTQVNIQLVPIYGFSLGILYYNPNLEPDIENVDPEDYYDQITFIFFVFGIHITWFRI